MTPKLISTVHSVPVPLARMYVLSPLAEGLARRYPVAPPFLLVCASLRADILFLGCYTY